MTIINIRSADGFTLHDNYYAIPDDMPLGYARAVVEECTAIAATWEELDFRLLRKSVEPVPNASDVPAVTFDVDF